MLFDPAGSYRSGERGSGDAFYDSEANLADYVKHQADADGPDVEIFEFPTKPEEDAQIIEM